MKILHLSVSTRGEASLSRRLATEVLDRLQNLNPNAQCVTRDLVTQAPPHLSPQAVAAMFTPPPQQSPELRQAIAESDALVAELLSADVLVLDSPMYNWSTPSALKAWIDHIVRPGLTFIPGRPGHAYRPLVADRPVYIVLASGGVYTGARSSEDFLSPYLKHVLSFIGLQNLSFIRAEGVLADSEAARESGREQIQALFAT